MNSGEGIGLSIVGELYHAFNYLSAQKEGKKALDLGGTSRVALAKAQVEHWLDNQRRHVMSFESICGFQ